LYIVKKEESSKNSKWQALHLLFKFKKIICYKINISFFYYALLSRITGCKNRWKKPLLSVEIKCEDAGGIRGYKKLDELEKILQRSIGLFIFRKENVMVIQRYGNNPCW